MIPAWAELARRNDWLIVRALEEQPQWYWQTLLPRLVRDEATGCLLWTGAVNSGSGYGRGGGYGAAALPHAVAAKPARVHRVAYILATGRPVPYGRTLDHLCGVRRCAEPSHLEAVSIRTNVLRGGSFAADHAARTHCPKGHPLDDGNLRPSSLKHGGRSCLTCNREAARARSAAVRAARQALGLTHSQYIAEYGQSRATAERVLAEHMMEGEG